MSAEFQLHGVPSEEVRLWSQTIDPYGVLAIKARMGELSEKLARDAAYHADTAAHTHTNRRYQLLIPLIVDLAYDRAWLRALKRIERVVAGVVTLGDLTWSFDACDSSPETGELSAETDESNEVRVFVTILTPSFDGDGIHHALTVVCTDRDMADAVCNSINAYAVLGYGFGKSVKERLGAIVVEITLAEPDLMAKWFLNNLTALVPVVAKRGLLDVEEQSKVASGPAPIDEWWSDLSDRTPVPLK